MGKFTDTKSLECTCWNEKEHISHSPFKFMAMKRGDSIVQCPACGCTNDITHKVTPNRG